MIDDSTSFTFRLTMPADVELLAQQRGAMFLAMGRIQENEVEPLVKASLEWFQGLIDRNEYVGWYALDGDRIVACGGIHLRDDPPRVGSYRIGRWGHIINIFTEPEYRRRGLARRITQMILDWAEAEKLDRVTLTAAPAARGLYETLGFTATADMQLTRKPGAEI